MIYKAVHTTRYTYEGPVSQSYNDARLTPRPGPRQLVRECVLRMRPEPVSIRERKDYFGNTVTRFEVAEPHDQLVITAISTVEVRTPELPVLTPSWEQVRNALAVPRPDPESLGVFEFVCESPFVPRSEELAAFAQPSFQPGRPLVEAALDLMRRIYSGFQYEPKSTSIDTPVADVLRQRRGVCQDFAHVMIGALRSIGLPARYVSGYLRSGQGAEASHAWVSIFVPGYGWLDFDPTNNLIPAEGHITLALGRDYGDVTPIKGVALGGGEHTVEVEVRVRPWQDRPIRTALA